MAATIEVTATYASGTTAAHGTFTVPGLKVTRRELAALKADPTVLALTCDTCAAHGATECPSGV